MPTKSYLLPSTVAETAYKFWLTFWTLQRRKQTGELTEEFIGLTAWGIDLMLLHGREADKVIISQISIYFSFIFIVLGAIATFSEQPFKETGT